ncbi:helix-turn-helix domain-containing protein [Staphylococcus kloosii]|nr:helix-turn-helix domain-containing protein [Staphylococcus kloosii]
MGSLLGYVRKIYNLMLADRMKSYEEIKNGPLRT